MVRLDRVKGERFELLRLRDLICGFIIQGS